MVRGENSRFLHDRGRGRGFHQRGRPRRHTFTAETFRKKFEESHYARGGSKQDPLNLNGLEADPQEACSAPQQLDVSHSDTEENSSFLPKNKRDPLNLKSIGKEKKKRQRDRDRSRSQSPIPAKLAKADSSQEVPSGKSEEQKEAGDNAVDQIEKEKTAKDKKEFFNKKYCYGNFDRYYGIRLDAGQRDSRLEVLRKEWFEKKTILDIGCNVGLITIAIAKDYAPRRILGIDIDDHLIGVARKNIRHYCDESIEIKGKYPASFSQQFGPVAHLPTTFKTKFPDNVWFRRENYVLQSDELLETIQEEFDVIMALSITKWIHLNWGDDGIRRFFLRAFRQLRPGGRLILEVQPYTSYRKRSVMTEAHRENYRRIEFRPSDFEMYLLETVGFESVEHVEPPSAKTKGFQRPINVYIKKGPNSISSEKASESTPTWTTPIATPTLGATQTPSTGAELTDISPAYKSSDVASA
ncbi:unnamed protein product, partial [Mesorhabditis belari]|uniref:RNA methyltransferase n=1 Tax=Mesorhabditis belari TaxID=2138241 RepID=A0AAF3ERH3_9BILA